MKPQVPNFWGSEGNPTTPPQPSGPVPNFWNTSSTDSVQPVSSDPVPNFWKGPSSDLVNQAESQLGKTDFTGLCEAWQEKLTGSPKMGLTAADAWNNYAKQGQAVSGLQGAQPGDKIYFAGDGGAGHTGIVSKVDNQGVHFVSATDNGVQDVPVNNWLKNTGQQLLGIVPRS